MSSSLQNKRELGAEQEAAARSFLEQKGYKILESNYYIRGGELDMIAMDGPVLCFIEVRSRNSTRYGHPLETISYTKQKRIIKAAKHYIMVNQPECEMRFDAVGIVLHPFEITLIKDAFQVSE